jgi:hypothetical protein
MCDVKKDANGIPSNVDEKQIQDNINSLEEDAQRIGPTSTQDVMADFENEGQKDLADD